MQYVTQRKIHDADAHIFETPDWLIRYVEPSIRSRLKPLNLHGKESSIAEATDFQRSDEPSEADADGDPSNILARNWDSLGAFNPQKRRRALDLLGFNTQLIFSTYSHLTFIDNPGAPPGSDFSPDVLYAAVEAHNRGIVDFCSVDQRLLPVGWVAIDVPDKAIMCCKRALDMGCAGIELPSYPTGPLSLTHPDLHPIYQMLEESKHPLLFHVGGGGQVVAPVFSNNGRDSILHPLTFIGISAPLEMALSALVLDGIFEKFPRLMCGVIEHGASWLPGFMRRLDYAAGAFQEARVKGNLSLWPSEYIVRNVRVTPFPFEDVSWLVEECGSCIFVFGSDYPHDEGGADPVSMFDATLRHCSSEDRDLFYWKNFEQLMGAGCPIESSEPSMESVGTTFPLIRSNEPDQRAPAEETIMNSGSNVLEHESHDVSQKKALMRLLARQTAQELGITVECSEIQLAMDDFRRQNQLFLLTDMQQWMNAEGVDEESLVRILRDGILLDKLASKFTNVLEGEIETQTRVGTVRTWRQKVGEQIA